MTYQTEARQQFREALEVLFETSESERAERIERAQRGGFHGLHPGHAVALGLISLLGQENAGEAYYLLRGYEANYD